jgi:hypothetical protein
VLKQKFAAVVSSRFTVAFSLISKKLCNAIKR